jgi:N-carbamoylputrescine amidase
LTIGRSRRIGTIMKVTVCEMNDDPEAFELDWTKLASHVRSQESEFVLLPEMPFAPWFGTTKSFDTRVWQASVDAHDRWLSRLGELSAMIVLGTRPINHDGKRLNEAFCWTERDGYQAVHSKYYLPDEAGFFEASWYDRGDGSFSTVQCGRALVGFEICTEMWAFDHARLYGKQGVDIIATPRATEEASVETWLVGGRATAISSGAYSLSSNRSGLSKDGTVTFGGHGWIVGPDGKVLGLTSSLVPFVTIDVDLTAAEEAKLTYPRYAL